MFDRLDSQHGGADSALDASPATEQKVLDLLAQGAGDPHDGRVRKLIQERFESMRAAPETINASVAGSMLPVGRPYAEPGSVADRLRWIEDRGDGRDEAIECLLEEVERLKRRTDELEARLTAAETGP